MEDREIAGALRARGGEAGLLGRIESQRIHETIAIIVAQVHDFAARDRAVTFRQLRISFGMQALGFLVIDDPVGFERRIAKIELHIADSRNALIGVIVVNFLRANEHLLLRTLRPYGRLRPCWERQLSSDG